MRSIRKRLSGRGYSAVELLIVIAIIGILAAMGVPWIINIVHKTKMEGLLSKTGFMYHLARNEAVKQNFITVVRADLDASQITAFADLNGAALGTPPDGIFNPIDGEPDKTTDYELATFDIPNGISFAAPDTLAVVDGLTAVAGERVAIFIADGSIVDIGAVRFGDARANFFEIRVAPQGTARVQIRKWDEVDEEWFEQGEENRVWQWF